MQYISISMKHLLHLFIFAFTTLALSQEQSIKAIKTNTVLLTADDFIGFDGLGNCFYLQNNVVHKKGETTMAQYQNLALGKITKVDILNPLKVVVFYKDFNSVVLLDSQLNEIQRVDFSKLDTPIVASAVGISGQNKLWLFNSLNQQIGLYDLTNNNYQNLGVPIKEEFQYYQSDFNYFHWIDSDTQWNTCTVYGTIFTNGKTEGNESVQLLDNKKLLFAKQNKIYLKDIEQDKVYEIEIVEKSFKKMYYKDQILSIFTDQGITNYKITIP